MLFRLLTDLLSSVYINNVYLLIIIIDNEGGRKLPFRIRCDLVCLLLLHIHIKSLFLSFCVTSFIQLSASDVAIVRALTFDSTQNDFIFIVVFDLSKKKKKRIKIKETKIQQRNLQSTNRVEDETIVLIIAERFQLYIYRFVYLLWYCELLLRRWTMRMVAPLKSDYYYCCGWFFHSFVHLVLSLLPLSSGKDSEAWRKQLWRKKRKQGSTTKAKAVN